MIRRGVLFLLPMLLTASVTLAGDTGPKVRPTVGGGYPSPQPPSARTADVRGPATSRNAAGSSADAGVLRGVVLKTIAEGSAQVTIEGRTQSLRPGDALAGYVVTSISGGRIVLLRGNPGQVASDATAIMTFDARGQARVRVFSTKDPTLPSSSLSR